ncbi:hypothetical protein HZ993_20895 [Rhodoferax sp. AJA081-3]|uniref:hypothetical protein n=1 Tax=Rhodoferax sp. AJA081-3 TaxID=2752316 RepID=UPI001ADFB3C8|nr:hypothetical protein [Rhodoferax sp. AJA081-3]QTN27690.1 hypothetical protein HZ993_20895 [Rhodoferax sp. AJA081-3]
MNFQLLSSRPARAVILALTCMGLASAASAMSLRELRGLAKAGKQGPDYVNYYLVGVMEGALEAHAHAVRNGATPTICLDGRRLEPFMAKSLFDTELKRNADVYEADMSAQLVMVNALSTVYPCQ